ncbi:UxaA family hydrolase [Duganella sp. Root1480D1]|uniref:UxaA family hydrolase n=1 Tax=Duganella sp. Root1480D1 TaxID=1736471 RepID=UPI000710B188|nr:UxaA family hydrolase [Duganella sp. Root1480D1]KQZ28248.1 hydrolase [Duganella sp. Root1480D1]
MLNSTPPNAPQLLLMSPEDNCLIARTALAAGDIVDIDGVAVTLPEDIPLGYKVARHALQPGEKVLRYGALIGSVTAVVARGAMLHTHNLASDYLPTYTLGADAHVFIGSGH